MQRKEELIRKLFFNQCSREELEELFEIIKDDPSESGPEVMMELREQLRSIPALKAEWSDEIYARIEEGIGAGPDAEKAVPLRVVSRDKRRYWWISSAAAIALILGFSWYILRPEPIEQLAYQTAYGEMETFFLPDSSTVILNGNSTIRFPSRWDDGDTRVVELDGEAFFKVRKQLATQAKFRVITNDLTVEVLGTHFNVNTRKEETEVFLEEGKVQVQLDHKDDQIIDLVPGEGVRYSTKKQSIPPTRFAEDETPNWRKGFMQFTEESLQTILEEIAQSHQLDFIIPDTALANTKYNLTLPVQDMDETMDVLSKSAGIVITKKNGEYEIIEE